MNLYVFKRKQVDPEPLDSVEFQVHRVRLTRLEIRFLGMKIEEEGGRQYLGGNAEH